MVSLFTPYCTIFGSQTQAGSNVVAPFLTLVTMLRFQKRYDKINYRGSFTTTPKTPLNLRFSSALDELYNYSDILTNSELAKVGAVKICEYKLEGS
jgi:hypothetical protein